MHRAPERATILCMTIDLHITGDDASDTLLSTEPLALLIGMLLDQQVPMETAFAGPAKIRDRMGSLDAAAIAERPSSGTIPECAGRPWKRTSIERW